MSHAVATTEPDIGDKVGVFWPVNNCFFPEMVNEEQNYNKTVVYDDGGIETSDVANETWRYASSAKLCALSASSYELHSGM